MVSNNKLNKNDDVNILDLYRSQSQLWEEKNKDFFGLTSVSSSESPFIIKSSIKNDLQEYWINGTCKLKEHLLETNKFKCRNKMISDSWGLEYNNKTNVIRLSASFIFPANNKGMTSNEAIQLAEEVSNLEDSVKKEVIKNDLYVKDNKEYILVKETIAYLPLVTKLGFKIKKSEYVLRIQAYKNNYLIRKINGVVSQKNWSYSCKNKKFADGKNHFEDVHESNHTFLSSILGEPVTEDNFTKALDLMPEYDNSSITYFKFAWYDEIENTILRSNRTTNPECSKIINYATMLNTQNQYSSKRDIKDLSSNLVRIESKISALEQSRSVIYSPPVGYHSSFSFKDATQIFDAFKVTTNALAGRIRILLDRFYVNEDGLICIDYDNKTYNQYDIILGHGPKELSSKVASNISCISKAPYNYLNDAKRIMFCAKLKAQSVRVKGQVDDLTNEVPARVVFADWEGFSFGDSFVISQSFAERLERFTKKKFQIDKSICNNFEIGQQLEVEDLVKLDGKNRFSSYHDIVVVDITPEYIEIEARLPFGVGDKITNMHGSKGIVSVILPDELMPHLMNDLSDSMHAGPIDVIVPGVSVFRRKACGQIFEAISRALNIPELDLKELFDSYGDQIMEYDAKSEFEFFGSKFYAPCGINHIIRLNHDATTKQSFAYIKTNYNFNLHFAEMELLNLASRGYYEILNELDIRSINKHQNSFKDIREMQKTGIISNKQSDMKFLKDFMKYLGWDFKVSNLLEAEDVDERWTALTEILDNKEIDIF